VVLRRCGEKGNKETKKGEAKRRGKSKMSDDESTVSSAPPVAAATHNAATDLHTHPLWARAAGQLPPKPAGWRGGGAGSENGDKPRFEPLSALALEIGGFRDNADGDSALFSEPDSASKPPQTRKRYNKEDGDDLDYDDDVSVYSSDEELYKEKKNAKKSKKTANVGDAAAYAAAAFGGAESDAASSAGMSGTSSQRRKKAYKAAFPISGVECVGCMLTKQIAPVEKFVKQNFEKMQEAALWKQAALCYVREVQEPRRREGVLTPAWSWKDLRSHFLLHCSDHTIARTFSCRQLQTMRYAVEQRLLRVNGDEREVDKSSCDLLLKIIQAESRERSILQGIGGGKKGAGASTVGDGK
tara:strand:+ start:788 stop:1855 length:1068 start_codon:yes stop_codon:yes gene_type:complete